MQLYVCMLLCVGLVAGIPPGLLDDFDDVEPVDETPIGESVRGPSVDVIFAKLGERLGDKFENIETMVERLRGRVDEMRGQLDGIEEFLESIFGEEDEPVEGETLPNNENQGNPSNDENQGNPPNDENQGNPPNNENQKIPQSNENQPPEGENPAPGENQPNPDDENSPPGPEGSEGSDDSEPTRRKYLRELEAYLLDKIAEEKKQELTSDLRQILQRNYRK